MKIINETNLNYQTIGQIIDKIIKSEKENTFYYGKVENVVIEVFGKKVRVQIRYLKRYVEWRFSYEDNYIN